MTKKQAIQADNMSETSSIQGRWRHKNQGALNYDATLVNISKQNQPNMVRDAYIREHHRQEGLKKYYQDLQVDRDREKEAKQRNRENELDWEKRYITNENNIFQINQEREQQLREEKRKRYAEELRQQIQQDHEDKLRKNRMTQVEKKINYDNLQAYKSWDPNNYASIPGWGGNAKYYKQLIAMGKDTESMKDLNNRMYGSGQIKKTDFAAIAENNLLN